MAILLKKLRLITYICISISVLFFIPAVSGQPLDMASGQASTETSESQQNPENEESNEDSGKVNFSESIPVDEVLSTWEDQYMSLMQRLGLGDSFSARVAASAVIVVVALIIYCMLIHLARWVRKKIKKRNALFRLSHSRVAFYYKSLIGFALAVVVVATFTALAATWGADLEAMYTNGIYLAALSNVITIFLIVMVGMVVVDAINGLVETAFRRWGSSRRSRVDTLLPIAKNTVYVTFFVIFTLMLLAELGINVVPLLAGAGVVGFAIGFGAQTLIKDLLTGFIIIFEDLIQVGDVARLADKVGLVEKITIRKVQLRDLSGTVFTVPFSEISVVENLTKDFSYAMFDVGVAYREDIGFVCSLLEKIGEDLQQDGDFSDDILEPLEILGLDKFGDSAIVVKARIKTQPIQQWRIMREFNRRMKCVFDDNNVEIPFPHQTIYFGEDRDGQAPPMRVENISAEEAAPDDSEQEATLAKQGQNLKDRERREQGARKHDIPDNDEGDGD